MDAYGAVMSKPKGPRRSRRHLVYTGLVLVWSLLLVQAMFPPEPHVRISWVGAAFWAAVEVLLVVTCVRAWPRRNGRRRPERL